MTWVSQSTSPVGCHPLTMSHFKFKSLCGVRMLTRGGSLVSDWCCLVTLEASVSDCNSGLSPTSLWFWALLVPKGRLVRKKALEKRSVVFISLSYSRGNASCFSLRQVFHFASDRSCFCYDSSSLVQFVEHFASCL